MASYALTGLISITLVLLLAPDALRATPIELDFSLAPGLRARDRFQRGMSKFHSTIVPAEVGLNSADDARRLSSWQLSLRFPALLSDERDGHVVGFTMGMYNIPAADVSELRSDRLTTTSWEFDLPYIMFTYHYRRPLRWGVFRRRWQWEFGGGLGFLMPGRWRVNGLLINSVQTANYDSLQTARDGNIWRLGLGLQRSLGSRAYVRFGLRLSYALMGRFSGGLNNLDAEWYYTQDGGLAPVSSFDLLNTPAPVPEPIPNAFSAAVIDERADAVFGMTEFYFGVGIRF